VAGFATAAWGLVVWQWQDPFTAAYTHWKQHQLAGQYSKLVRAYRPADAHGSLAAERRVVGAEALAFRRTVHRGQAIGRIRIPRMGIDMLLVQGTDHASLEKGPGHDARSRMPGENRLVYIAGHRTTYLAPFSHIDRLRAGDPITLEMPYGRFVYRVFTHRIVVASNLTVLRSPAHEQLELQACHPRFFASHRYIVYAHLVRVVPRSGRPFAPVRAVAAGG
jgi:sortase A